MSRSYFTRNLPKVRPSLDDTGVVIESLSISELPVHDGEGRILSLYVPNSDLPEFIDRLIEQEKRL